MQKVARWRGGRGVASLRLFCSIKAKFWVEVAKMEYVEG